MSEARLSGSDYRKKGVESTLLRNQSVQPAGFLTRASLPTKSKKKGLGRGIREKV